MENLQPTSYISTIIIIFSNGNGFTDNFYFNELKLEVWEKVNSIIQWQSVTINLYKYILFNQIALKNYIHKIH